MQSSYEYYTPGTSALRLLRLCLSAPSTAVAVVRTTQSPIANAATIGRRVGSSTTGYIYNITRVGSFTTPAIDTRWNGSTICIVSYDSYPRRHGQLVGRCFAQEHKRTSHHIICWHKNACYLKVRLLSNLTKLHKQSG